jgi:hypothetical protein
VVRLDMVVSAPEDQRGCVYAFGWLLELRHDGDGSRRRPIAIGSPLRRTLHCWNAIGPAQLARRAHVTLHREDTGLLEDVRTDH